MARNVRVYCACYSCNAPNMLTIFGGHWKSCRHVAKGRKHRHCGCPISVEGTLRGVMVRRSLDLRSWEAAQKLVRDWEIEGKKPATVTDAADRFLADRRSAQLSASMLAKYRDVADEFKEKIGSLPLRGVAVDDVRRIMESWNLAPIADQKRLERVRKFFAFCVGSEWIEPNPAKQVKLPPAKYEPTLPFTDEQMEKILWAAVFIRETHPKIPKGSRVVEAVFAERDEEEKKRIDTPLNGLPEPSGLEL